MTPEERQAKVKWLSRYRILENQIKRLEAEAERWRSRAANTVPAPVHFKYYDSNNKNDQKFLAAMTRQELRRNNMMPVVVRGSSGLGIDDCIAEISDIQCQIKEKISQSTKVRSDIGKAIDGVPDDKLQLVLYYKYVDGLYLEEICCKMKYSYQHAKRLHNEAIAILKHEPQ
ncbi:DUF1492 domain-containing protein [Acetobacterium wieringae]|uniref:DUF1492 domain-containing protein n=1 Tax=Acetobacterium wieringae TaxID=52694 RepID=UPI0020346F64|nr:DUF1492 domain-containing protein [Acetobacterium wieringae]URN83984.1 DUF1492 domain-containing protein [Acetobacterium wieringae]URN85162.1 DUF1492 domain-containing protein [Acetobacterium wieringae]